MSLQPHNSRVSPGDSANKLRWMIKIVSLAVITFLAPFGILGSIVAFLFEKHPLPGAPRTRISFEILYVFLFLLCLAIPPILWHKFSGSKRVWIVDVFFALLLMIGIILFGIS